RCPGKRTDSCYSCSFCSVHRSPPPTCTLFPYTTLFRSRCGRATTWAPSTAAPCTGPPARRARWCAPRRSATSSRWTRPAAAPSAPSCSRSPRPATACTTRPRPSTSSSSNGTRRATATTASTGWPAPSDAVVAASRRRTLRRRGPSARGGPVPGQPVAVVAAHQVAPPADVGPARRARRCRARSHQLRREAARLARHRGSAGRRAAAGSAGRRGGRRRRPGGAALAGEAGQLLRGRVDRGDHDVQAQQRDGQRALPRGLQQRPHGLALLEGPGVLVLQVDGDRLAGHGERRRLVEEGLLLLVVGRRGGQEDVQGRRLVLVVHA